jgi:hypothetical protein
MVSIFSKLLHMAAPQNKEKPLLVNLREQGISQPLPPISEVNKRGENSLNTWLMGAAKEVGFSNEFTTPEATCLRICVDAFADYKPFTWDSMSYLLTQLPSIMQVEFISVGEADAVVVIPALAEIITKLHHFFPAVSILVCTSGDALLSPNGLALLESPLTELRIQLAGHQLSSFKALTGKTTGDFIALQETIYRYITHRKQLRNKALIQTISVSYVLNNYQYQKDVPEILKQAEQLGVDAVFFSNRLPENKLVTSLLEEESSIWFEAITADNADVLAYFQSFPAENYRVAITWPTVWQTPAEWGTTELNEPDDIEETRVWKNPTLCTAPYHTVNINLAFQASGCPRWQIGTVADWHPVWRGDFWQNAHFKQLRTIHALESSAFQDKTSGDLIAPVGFEACRKCPSRCTASASQQIAPANQHLL